jgi:hypothetical protein
VVGRVGVSRQGEWARICWRIEFVDKEEEEEEIQKIREEASLEGESCYQEVRIKTT